MKTITWPILLSLCLAHFALAQGKIEGAFGKRFGDEFQPPDVSAQALGDGFTVRCRFQPDKPFAGLTDYTVEVTPVTHRVCAIIATGPPIGEEEAWRLVTVLEILLREKYSADPAPVNPGLGYRRFSSTSGFSITQGTRVILIGSELRRPPPGQHPSASVYLNYRDSTLLAEARKEAEAIRGNAKAADKASQEKRDLAARDAFEKKRAEEERRRAVIRKELEIEAKKIDASGL